MKPQLTLSSPRAGTYTAPAGRFQPWNHFLAWCEGQEINNHWLWTGLTVGIQGCLLTPLVLWAIAAFHLPDGYLLGALLASFSVVIPNLSALSTRVIIPIFGASSMFTLVTVAVGLLG